MLKGNGTKWMTVGVAVGVIGLIVGLSAWGWILESSRTANAQADLRDATSRASEHFSDHIAGVEEYLWLLNDHLEQGTLTQAQLISKAERYVAGHPSIVAINFADENFVVRWSVPTAQHTSVVGLSLDLSEPKRASRLARQTHHSAYTDPFEVVQGNMGFEIYVPAFRGEEFLGTLSVVFSVDGMLAHVLPASLQTDHHIGLLHAGKIVGELGKIEPGALLTSETEVLDGRMILRGSETAPSSSMHVVLVVVVVLVCGVSLGFVLRIRVLNRSAQTAPVKPEAFGELSQTIWLFTTDAKGILVAVSDSLAELVGEPTSGLLARITPENRVANVSRELLLGAEAPRHSDIRLKLSHGGEKQLMMFSLAARSENQFVHILLNRRASSEGTQNTRRGYKATSQSLAQMAGGIAHNFNNLLMAVLGNLEMVLIEPRNTTTTARRMLDDAREAARRAAELSTQMLVYVGQGRRTAKSVDLEEIVSGVVEQIDLSQWRDVDFRTVYSSQELPVRVDVDQIKKVISGLMVNAFEALPGGKGALTIKTGECVLTPSAIDELTSSEGMTPGTFVWFSVEDNGSGIEITPIQRIFEPFFTTKFAGRGLGLSAVQGIIRGHRGGIDVHSVFGKGTEFKVFLPLPKTSRSRSPSGPHETGVWRGSGLVLLVDDDPTILTLCEMMLKRIGFDVVSTSSGTEALELYEENNGKIRVALLDLLLPELSGEEVFQSLRARDSKLKIIIVSAFDQQEVNQRLAGQHLDGFVHKPFELADLRHQLRRALDEEYSGVEAVVEVGEED